MKHYFAGSNTCTGFAGAFESIFDTGKLKHLFVLKGGPGVGKSSLMKRIAAYLDERGSSVECFHCSSDPDSLDGIIVDGRFAVADGTAPHIVDPVMPGAADTLISLGDGLDAAGLGANRGRISELTASMQRQFKAAHGFVAAAEGAYCAAGALISMDEYQTEEVFEGIAAAIPAASKGKSGGRRLFLSAVTPDGLRSLLDAREFAPAVRIEAPWCADLTRHLRRLAARLTREGHDVQEAVNPVNACRLEGLIVDDIPVLVRDEPIAEERLFAVDSDCLNAASRERARRMYADAIAAACEQLARARELHSQIERFYTSAMDFSVCDRAFERVIGAIEI